MTILFNKATGMARWLDVDGIEPWWGWEYLGKFGRRFWRWNIGSLDAPEIWLDGRTIYLPGSDTETDLLPFGCPADQMESVAQALTEWAEKASVPMEVRWK